MKPEIKDLFKKNVDLLDINIVPYESSIEHSHKRIMFKRQNFAKCKLCKDEIPSSVLRWKFGSDPASHVCPDCFEKVCVLLSDFDKEIAKKLGFTCKTQSHYKLKDLYLIKNMNIKCTCCQNKSDEFFFKAVDYKTYWANKSYNYICKECFSKLEKVSHLDNYKEIKEKWIMQRVAKKI